MCQQFFPLLCSSLRASQIELIILNFSKIFYSLQLFSSTVSCKRKALIENKNNMYKYQAKALLCSVNLILLNGRASEARPLQKRL